MTKTQLVATTEFKIEKGLAPPTRLGRGARTKYPFRDMAVGDSILVPDASVRASKAAAAAAAWGRLHGIQFASRAVLGGVRVWRTA